MKESFKNLILNVGVLKEIKLLSFILFFLITSQNLFGQGNVIFEEPNNVKTLFNNYVMKNNSVESMKGWRIQLLSTSDRREMETEKARFNTIYPNIPSNWKHISPYYQLRVGAYRSRSEMSSFLIEVKKEFPAAIAVQDEIKKYDLINY